MALYACIVLLTYACCVYLVLSGSPENIEEMKNKSLLEQLLSELGEQFPAIVEVVVEERDRYMAYQLQCLCREQPIRRYGNHLLDFSKLGLLGRSTVSVPCIIAL